VHAARGSFELLPRAGLAEAAADLRGDMPFVSVHRSSRTQLSLPHAASARAPGDTRAHLTYGPCRWCEQPDKGRSRTDNVERMGDSTSTRTDSTGSRRASKPAHPNPVSWRGLRVCHERLKSFHGNVYQVMTLVSLVCQTYVEFLCLLVSRQDRVVARLLPHTRPQPPLRGGRPGIMSSPLSSQTDPLLRAQGPQGRLQRAPPQLPALRACNPLPIQASRLRRTPTRGDPR